MIYLIKLLLRYLTNYDDKVSYEGKYEDTWQYGVEKAWMVNLKLKDGGYRPITL